MFFQKTEQYIIKNRTTKVTNWKVINKKKVKTDVIKKQRNQR